MGVSSWILQLVLVSDQKVWQIVDQGIETSKINICLVKQGWDLTRKVCPAKWGHGSSRTLECYQSDLPAF